MYLSLAKNHKFIWDFFTFISPNKIFPNKENRLDILFTKFKRVAFCPSYYTHLQHKTVKTNHESKEAEKNIIKY